MGNVPLASIGIHWHPLVVVVHRQDDSKELLESVTILTMDPQHTAMEKACRCAGNLRKNERSVVFLPIKNGVSLPEGIPARYLLYFIGHMYVQE